MAKPGISCNACQGFRRTLITWALPRIEKLHPKDWDEALKNARAADFDTIEKIGVFGSLALVTWLLRADAEAAQAISLPFHYLAQFLAAAPLLTLLAGPFYLRCLRRGLENEISEIERRHRVG